MRPVEGLNENGLLRPAKPLNLRPGERVGLIVVRRSDPSRWDLKRLAAGDVDLASAGLDDFGALLELHPSNACRNDNKNANRFHQSQPIVHFKMEELAEMQETFAGYFTPANLSAPFHPQRVHWQASAPPGSEPPVPSLLVPSLVPSLASQPVSIR